MSLIMRYHPLHFWEGNSDNDAKADEEVLGRVDFFFWMKSWVKMKRAHCLHRLPRRMGEVVYYRDRQMQLHASPAEIPCRLLLTHSNDECLSDAFGVSPLL